MKTLEQFLNIFHSNLVSATSQDGTSFIKLSEDLENREVYQDIIREVHEGSLPKNEIYDCIDSLLAEITAHTDLEYCSDIRDLEIDGDFNVDSFSVSNYSYYANQALQECQPKTFTALESFAEIAFISDIKTLLLDAIADLEGVEWDYSENLEDAE